MIIFNSLSEIKNTEPAVVALGNFDGIHRGHGALIKTAVERAKEKNVKSEKLPALKAGCENAGCGCLAARKKIRYIREILRVARGHKVWQRNRKL